MFGVIVCPRCGRARGVDLSMARVNCPGCGRGIELSRARVYFSTEDLSELAEAVRQVAREVAPPQDPSQEEGWALGTEREEALPKKMDEHGLTAAAQELTERGGSFTIQELAEHLGIEDLKWVEAHLSRLLSQGTLYEPEPGLFRAV